MSISFNQNNSKQGIFEELSGKLQTLDFQIEDYDFNRPWGGFFVISEAQVEKFISKFFPNLKFTNTNQKLSPKLLVVEPEKRLSWQYHDRRNLACNSWPSSCKNKRYR
jgi:mannose-6-phosphate isomerase